MWNVFVSLFVCYTHNMPQIHSFTASPFGSRCFGHQEPRCCALKLDSKSRRIRCCNTAANKKTSLDTSASISILHQLNVQVVHSYARTLAFVLCNPTIPRAESVHKEVSWLGLNLLRYTDAKHHCWMPHLAKKKRWACWPLMMQARTPSRCPQSADPGPSSSIARLHSRSGWQHGTTRHQQNLAGTNWIQLHTAMVLPLFSAYDPCFDLVQPFIFIETERHSMA